ncbi:MAG: Phospholipase C [Cirrosporium novae-zelandiae]|nr:MAG: Phospholipase C [Cirrosporium novae-zelandiae]
MASTHPSRSTTPDTIKATRRSPPLIPFPRLAMNMPHFPSSSTCSTTTAPTSAGSSTSHSYMASPVQTSITSSPDSFRGRMSHTSTPNSFDLEEPALSYTNPSPQPGSQTSSDSVSASRTPNLMRRISRGAASRIRRRQSSTHNNRDHSTGPVILRRRSDSRSDGKKPLDVMDLGFGDDEEEKDDQVDSLGISGLSSSPAPSSRSVPLPAGGVAPTLPAQLQRGIVFTKMTKNKKKSMRFWIDIQAAKVYWDQTNPTKKFYIDDIMEIRTGYEAKNYREEFQIPDELAKRWITILYADPDRSKGRSTKTMHLLAESKPSCAVWTKTLEDVSRYRMALMAGVAGSRHCEAALRAYWHQEMSKHFGDNHHTEEQELLGLEKLEKLCKGLHINCSANILRAHFMKADTHARGSLDYNEFKDFIRRLKERKDIKALYLSIVSNSGQGLSMDEFFQFLRSSQAIPVEAEYDHWVTVFHKFARKSKSKSQLHQEAMSNIPPHVNFDGFSAFITSAFNNALLPLPDKVTLDRPLNEYFISSSHNTYLMGRQVAGESSTEAYIKCLSDGCRCIEIDCWDGQDGRPIVSHGHTMTTSILFQDCIDVIGKFAFYASSYPLILSLEVHCCAEQQEAMVTIMKKSFGDSLLLERVLNKFTTLPSPEEIKYRILVKVKSSDEVDEALFMNDVATAGRKRSASSPFARPVPPDGIAIPTTLSLSSPPTISQSEQAIPVWGPTKRSMTSTSISSSTEDSDTVSNRRDRKKKQKSKIIKSLADLGVYTRGQKWTNFEDAESRTYNHVFSFAERNFEGMCKDPHTKSQLEWHNTCYLTRVYPSGFRVKSSNFDPNTFWRRGVQMVALNWQTYDTGMQMNNAMFASGTDRTGYVLKPKELRHPRHSQDPSREAPSPRLKLEKQLVKFSVEVISAHQLPRPKGMWSEDSFNPYIEIEMFSAEDKSKGIASGEGGLDASARNGMSGIGLPHRRRTRIAQSNGYDPTYHDGFKLLLETKYPGLVFVRWSVWNSSDGKSYNSPNSNLPLATFTAKLSSLQEGYRHLPLFDGAGDQYIFSKLFCKIHKEAPESGDIARNSIREIREERVSIFSRINQSIKRTLSNERRISPEER